ncbi:MAG TPA: FAD-dependent oxidoreductase [Bacteroidetes bacterium]|nr:FAD-dependent oxidoreductase [Bacteroidota bacterium]
MKNYDFLVIGGGIFGLGTAIELCKRKYSVCILDAGKIPNPLAASTDISKVVRMEYGSDVEYMQMAIESINGWREWNDFFNEVLFHETGFLLLAQNKLESGSQYFEKSSFDNLIKKGFMPERLNPEKIAERFPAFNCQYYEDGFYHPVAGFAESGRVVEVLAEYAKQLGADIYENQKAGEFIVLNKKINGLKTREGNQYTAGHIIVCAGNFTPYIVPELKAYMKVTGHPVFHIKPSRPELFEVPRFSVFAADISNTGWYGFPLHPKEKVVKIALHSKGLELHPGNDGRIVTKEDENKLRQFLKQSIPALAHDPISHTRRCCYTDTLDGHFWIDRHPEIKGLTIGSGGSGHGFKMAPVIGDMIARVAEGGSHKWSARYRWRELNEATSQREEARCSL